MRINTILINNIYVICIIFFILDLGFLSHFVMGVKNFLGLSDYMYMFDSRFVPTNDL